MSRPVSRIEHLSYAHEIVLVIRYWISLTFHGLLLLDYGYRLRRVEGRPQMYGVDHTNQRHRKRPAHVVALFVCL